MSFNICLIGISDIQTWTKRSLGTAPFCLVDSNDWMVKTRKVDVRKVYIDLSLQRRLSEAHGIDKKPIQDLAEMLREVKMGEETPLRVLLRGKKVFRWNSAILGNLTLVKGLFIRVSISAEGGMGKTTALKYLAATWSDGTLKEIEKFDFVFHIALKHVKDNSPIEDVIIAEHRELESNKVKPEEIKMILEGHKTFAGKVLLLIDGHDEYKPGTNSDIDKTIEKRRLGSCCLLLTSRETEEIARIKDSMDAEFEIEGFDGTNIHKYIKRSVGSEEQADELLSEAVDKKLCFPNDQEGYDFTESFLMIPMLLNIICNLFRNNISLPKTKTETIESLVNKVIDREAIRAKGKKAVKSAEQALRNLGKLAWKGLNARKSVFSKASNTFLQFEIVKIMLCHLCPQ